jgi:membrane protein DedA with SNARE-associated domain
MSVVFEIIEPILDFVTFVISNLGYPGVIFLMILDSAMIPIPSEIILVFSGYLVTTGTFEPVSVILAGSFGNVVGSILTYYFGLKFGRLFVLRFGKYFFIKENHLEYTEKLFQKYGDKISFLGRLLPAIRTYISLPCGIAKINLFKYSIYTFFGSVIWNTMFTYIGIQLGSNWKDIDNYSIYLEIVSVCVIVAFIIWFITKTLKKRNLDKKSYCIFIC